MRHNAPTRFTSDSSADRINEISGAFGSFREMKTWLKVYVGNAMIFTLAPHKTLCHSVLAIKSRIRPTFPKTLCMSTTAQKERIT